MKALGHVACVAALAAVLIVAPTFVWGDARALAALTGADADLVSSATEIQASPDGSYVILLNRSLHPDTLEDWVTFFEGQRDAPLIMEDVSAVTIEGDAAGSEMAASLQSRLAEHQMGLRREVGPLALSKAEAGRFDVLVMSAEAAERYGAESCFGLPFVEVVRR